MNLLVEKNLSISQSSKINQVDSDDDDDDEDHDDKTDTFFYRFTRWLQLIKRWKHKSIPEVCKHIHKSSLNSKKKHSLIFFYFLVVMCTNTHIDNCLKAY